MNKIFSKDLLRLGDRLYLPFSIEPGLSSIVVRKFINCLIVSGKKEKAFSIFRKTMQLLNSYDLSNSIQFLGTDINGWLIFRNAIYNTMPLIGVKKKARGRKKKRPNLIPYPLPRYRQIRLSIRWLLEAALQHRTRGRFAAKKGASKMKNKSIQTQSVLAKQPIHVRLALELLKASRKEGSAVMKRFSLHQQAYKNRSFLRYRY